MHARGIGGVLDRHGEADAGLEGVGLGGEADRARDLVVDAHADRHVEPGAAERLGGKVLWANDDFFAEKENLLKAAKPIWIEGKYTDRGKWMDGWESRRRRTPGFDWCLIRLGLPGRIHGFVVDTSYFTGNYPERCQIEGVSAPESVTAEELDSSGTKWETILPESQLQGDTQNYFDVAAPRRFT